jgi:hypothetical protein
MKRLQPSGPEMEHPIEDVPKKDRLKIKKDLSRGKTLRSYQFQGRVLPGTFEGLRCHCPLRGFVLYIGIKIYKLTIWPPCVFKV